MDTQFAFGLTYPTPATLHSTGSSPPVIPDAVTLMDSNEPYVYVRFHPLLVVAIQLSFITMVGLRVLSRIPPSDDLHQL